MGSSGVVLVGRQDFRRIQSYEEYPIDKPVWLVTPDDVSQA